MNQQFVLQNLMEAAEHIDAAIEAARAGDLPRFEAWMPCAYRKLNAAWNSRGLSEEEAMQLHDYEIRCRLPTDLDDYFEA